MNKLFIIGNLTRAPELRQTQDGVQVCNFTVAVNRRTKADHPEADYFRVAAWRGLAETCHRYLDKGRKVAVLGAVSCRIYTDNNGMARAALEVVADSVEFLSPRPQAGPDAPDVPDGYVDVPDDGLPEGFAR